MGRVVPVWYLFEEHSTLRGIVRCCALLPVQCVVMLRSAARASCCEREQSKHQPTIHIVQVRCIHVPVSPVQQ